ncbi:hypothetical protein J31TS4_07840 [Paenibacillus sp. J31TS4]|uniref:rhodanese-like domain-containing protein n=1 Tax=Paenibacillus sp. J31TS4 TaxID=2807195 RepID=UPI001B0A6FD5|nr:rhodanese-like domain-containing protein [Paenibacillus sp. J31TS4]GIP37504.1 hypothetical protein J31TS4_07840 [Paenibacillus sp. J31TS4]
MEYESIDPARFLELLESGSLKEAVVLDVREPIEWDYYHLEEPTLLPMQQIPEKLQELPREKPIYILCAHGVRSEMVSRYLAGNGFPEVVNVEGGMAALAALRGFAYD